MSADELWRILNSNFVILLLSPAFGYVFVKKVWEPHKDRQEKKQRQQSFRDEVAFRLLYIEENLQNSSVVTFYVDGGSDANYLELEFQKLSLLALVYAG